MRFVVGITGASGSIYGLRFIEVLQKAGHEVHAVVTQSGWKVLAYECGMDKRSFSHRVTVLYDVEDIGAAIASGSFLIDGMIVVPCSMKTVGSIANAISDNLLTRAADVCLKEGRPLLIVPRETPVHAIHLENLLKLSRIGVKILPACPAFYHHPKDIADIVDMLVGKICDSLHIEHHLFERWQGGKD
jgi:flavin prenyltransferase